MIKGELFSQQFIPKLLDGTKIRTSRPIKPQPDWIQPDEKGRKPISFWDGEKWIKPKYRPGDIMYVRETWQSFFPEEVTEHHQQGARSFSGIPAETAKGHYMYFYYRADGEVPPDPKHGKAHWCHSIHMPREAARIFLRVTDVKVQHIDTMTEQDAVEDGFTSTYGLTSNYASDNEYGPLPQSALDQFKQFWLSQYGPDTHWMWVYYFKPISREEADHDR